eukprot:scaffold28332_cov31-Tisochrysis_lutea.AAC.12
MQVDVSRTGGGARRAGDRARLGHEGAHRILPPHTDVAGHWVDTKVMSCCHFSAKAQDLRRVPGDWPLPPACFGWRAHLHS